MAHADGAHTVSGNITFNGNPAPTSGSNLSVHISGSNGNGTGYSDTDGNYSVGSLADGDYNTSLNYNGGAEDSFTSGAPNIFSLRTSDTPTHISDSDVTQNLSFDTNTVTVTVTDENGNPMSDVTAELENDGNGSVTDTESNIEFSMYSGSEASFGKTDSNGQAKLNVFPGNNYSVCAINANSGEICAPDDITVTGDTTAEVSATTPTFTSGNTETIYQRQPFDFIVTTDGSPSPVLSESGTLPTGVTFSDNNAGDGTGTLSGEPAAGTAGTYPITITADNGFGGIATQSFTIFVSADHTAPAITSDDSADGTYGSPFSFTVNTTGYPIPTISKTGMLPSGVTFTNNHDGTATIAGTPTGTANGVYTLTIKAKSSAGTVTQTFTLTINRPPSIKTISTTTGHVGTALSIPITSTAYPTAALTESGALPSGLSFVDNGDGTGSIAGTPDVGSGGSYSVTITATNSLGTTDQTFTLKINETPVFTSASTTTAIIGTPFSFQVTATGFPAPSITKSGSLPAGITWNGTTKTFSGTAHAGTAGSYPITLTSTNSSGTVTQNFILVAQ